MQSKEKTRRDCKISGLEIAQHFIRQNKSTKILLVDVF